MFKNRLAWSQFPWNKVLLLWVLFFYPHTFFFALFSMIHFHYFKGQIFKERIYTSVPLLPLYFFKPDPDWQIPVRVKMCILPEKGHLILISYSSANNSKWKRVWGSEDVCFSPL